MNYRRSILFTLAAILLLTAFPALLYADAAVQTDADGQLPLPTATALPATALPAATALEDGIPPLVDGAPYPYPIISYAPPAQPAAPAADAPTIDVWYGSSQNFGQHGNPQEWVNILGRVSGPLPITSLTYSLNGGPDQQLSIGSNLKRLYDDGDFNIELPYTELLDGANTVVIKAQDGVTQATKSVIVNYDAGNVWPLSFSVNWSALGSIQDSAQIVDGQWAINGGRLETVVPGYDRLVAIGDVSWPDYEVTVPVTVLSLNTTEWGQPSNGAGVGLIVRWKGHTDNAAGEQPRDYWRRLGALAWHRWSPNGTTAFEIVGNGGGQELAKRTDQTIALNTPYIFKLSVQSSQLDGAPSSYRFKFWPQGQPEPAGWFMSTTGNTGEPRTGSLLLVAHQAMVSFGNVTITPLPVGPFTINVQAPANGKIVVSPAKASYEYGERVTIRAQGLAGYGLANWTGDFSGNQNPIAIDVTRNLTVGAEFAPLTEDIRLSVATTGQGNVALSPDKNKYLYGELVTLTPRPAVGYIFAGWTGDLSGADNPASLVMDRTRSVTAAFVPANAASPVSDDFNSCALNTGLWTFVNPASDGTYSVNGTQLQLHAPANVSHNIWLEGNRSVRVMQPTQNGNFEIVAKFESVVTQRYQMQGLLAEQDARNFLRFEVHHDGTHTQLFAARFVNGVPRAVITGVILTDGTPTHLRVTRVGDQWSFSYSYNGTTWTSGGSFIHALAVTKTGVYGANHGTPPSRPAPAHTAIVDYFFNSAAPIVPEDGDNAGNFTITTNKVGQGAVTLNPSKATYGCGEVVTVTAVPAAGWLFTGWSGDLTGSAPSQQLTVSRNYVVTATFIRGNFKTFLPMTVDK